MQEIYTTVINIYTTVINKLWLKGKKNKECNIKYDKDSETGHTNNV